MDHGTTECSTSGSTSWQHFLDSESHFTAVEKQCTTPPHIHQAFLRISTASNAGVRKPGYVATKNNTKNNILCSNLNVRGMRERSPPLPKIAHPSLPRLRRSQASTRQSARPESPPGGTACLITVSPVPGKLNPNSTALLIYPLRDWNTCGFRVT